MILTVLRVKSPGRSCGDRGQNKGITQLVATIASMKPDGYSFDHFKAKKVKGFPVLVVTDRFFNAPTMNMWLNKVFWEYMTPVSCECKTHDLIVVDLDTLIEFKSLFFNRRFDLASEIISYHQYIKTKYNTMDSFGQYLAGRVEHLGLRSKVSEELLAKVREILNTFQQRN